MIVGSDGSDRSHRRARRDRRGADLVLDLPRGGKVAALNAAVERSTGEVLAFSDANSFWERDALRRLVARLADPEVGYVCGQVRFDGTGGGQRGGPLLALRDGGAGTRVEPGRGDGRQRRDQRGPSRGLHLPRADPRPGHLVSVTSSTKRGWRAVYEPGAVARERIAATVGEEFGRKRRMMAGAWARCCATGCCRRADTGRHVRVRGRSRTASCATRRRCFTSSRWGPTSRCWAGARSTS